MSGKKGDKTMKCLRSLSYVVAAALLGGCVPKKQHEEVVAKLAACEAERSQAITTLATCQENAQREAERWNQVATAVQQEAPSVLKQLEAERTTFLQQLPEAVRTQVDSYLSKFAADVRRAFVVLSEENQKLAAQVEALSQTAGRTETKADTILTRMEAREKALIAEADRLQKGIAAVATQITEFDRTVINCRDCKERLSLNRKERETITAFHSRLVDALNQLRASGGGAASETLTDPPAAEPSSGQQSGS
jgi:uncharacterized phage infection (PIP) family protein YhgE